MKKDLCIKQIYNDFIDKILILDNEKEVLDLYIRNESLVKICDITGQSMSTVSRIIAELKDKYNIYKELEISKLNILMKK